MHKTIVGLYDDLDTARQAVQELERNGFRREDISLAARDSSGHEKTLSGDEAIEGKDVAKGVEAGAGVGAVLGGLAGLLVGIGALTIPGIGPVIAAGALGSTLAGAGIGAVAGGLVGALTQAGIPEDEANYYAEGVRRGGTLVMVTAPDTMEQKARSIMDRFGPVDTHERSSRWQQDNWRRFDAQNEPYTDEQIKQERARYQQSQWASNQPSSMGTSDTSKSGVRAYSRDDSSTTQRSTMQGETMGNKQTQAQTGKCESFADFYRRHYRSSYMQSGRPYEYYEPAYCFGYELRSNPRFSSIRDWSQLETQTRRDWEQSHPHMPWDDALAAIRAGWESVTA